jgi:hypothetical protein
MNIALIVELLRGDGPETFEIYDGRSTETLTVEINDQHDRL